MLVKTLRWLDRIMVRAIIPIESFGWVKLGTVQGENDSHDFGRWAIDGKERERFHAHNRRIDRERIALCKLANQIAGFMFKFWGIN